MPHFASRLRFVFTSLSLQVTLGENVAMFVTTTRKLAADRITDSRAGRLSKLEAKLIEIQVAGTVNIAYQVNAIASAYGRVRPLISFPPQNIHARASPSKTDKTTAAAQLE